MEEETQATKGQPPSWSRLPVPITDTCGCLQSSGAAELISQPDVSRVPRCPLPHSLTPLSLTRQENRSSPTPPLTPGTAAQSSQPLLCAQCPWLGLLVSRKQREGLSGHLRMEDTHLQGAPPCPVGHRYVPSPAFCSAARPNPTFYIGVEGVPCRDERRGALCCYES